MSGAFSQPIAKLTIASKDEPSIQVQAQYNPKELQLDQSVPWKKPEAANQTGTQKGSGASAGDDPIALEFTGAEGRTMTIEFLFDQYEGAGRKVAVAAEVAKLEQLARVRNPGREGRDQAPAAPVRGVVGRRAAEVRVRHRVAVDEVHDVLERRHAAARDVHREAQGSARRGQEGRRQVTVGAAAPNVDILLDGKELPDSDFISYVVDRDMFQPDMAAVVLSNQGDIYSPKLKIGATLEIKVGNDATSIYKGEVVGAEGTYKGGQTTRLLLRGMNKMHRLLRMRKSITFTEKNDQQIISQVCNDAKLSLDWKHEKSITYKHVYQHNLTDLEFIRTRAARMGCHVWCEDAKLFVKEPDLGQKSGIKLSVDQEGNLRAFTPRISSASVVKKVTVKGWNPETKELITGEAEAQASQLAKENAITACGDLGKEETFTVDHPIWSKEEADALAKARLRELNLTFITGEAEMRGRRERGARQVHRDRGQRDGQAGPVQRQLLRHRHHPPPHDAQGQGRRLRHDRPVHARRLEAEGVDDARRRTTDRVTRQPAARTALRDRLPEQGSRQARSRQGSPAVARRR